MRLVELLAAGAATLLCAQPCLAADDVLDRPVVERRTAAFAGLNLRLPIGPSAGQRPSARLQLTSYDRATSAVGATARRDRGPGLELGFDRLGRASAFVGGQPVRQSRERLNAGGSTTTWLIVGGVIVAVVLVAAVVASGMPTAGPPEGAFD